MKRICEAAVILAGILGWWGFVYPELCLTEDVYEQDCEEQPSCDIRIKSRLVEYVYERK